MTHEEYIKRRDEILQPIRNYANIVEIDVAKIDLHSLLLERLPEEKKPIETDEGQTIGWRHYNQALSDVKQVIEEVFGE